MWGLRKYAGPVDARSMPPTFVEFIATFAGRSKGTRIAHAVKRDGRTILLLSAWTERVLTAPTESTITLCFLWDIKPYLRRVHVSNLGIYCPFCGSAIKKTRKLRTSVSFSDMTSPNGLVSFPSARHVFSSLIEVRRRENRKSKVEVILYPIRSFGWGGNSTSWLDAVLNYARMYADVPISLLSVETALAVSAWNLHNLMRMCRPPMPAWGGFIFATQVRSGRPLSLTW